MAKKPNSLIFWIVILCSWLWLAACSSREVIVIGGGDNRDKSLDTVEIYKPSTGTFTTVSNTMSSGRMMATATTLVNGSVLIAGGLGSGSLNTAEIFQASNRRFTPTAGKMNHPRVAHTATLLDPIIVGGSQGGLVLLAGGDAFSVVGTAELYNSATGTFQSTGNMTVPRRQHTAVQISHCGCAADGSVLIVGGYDNQFKVLRSAELYNPSTQTFTPTGSLQVPRFRHTATLLKDGTVLITGGASQMAVQTGAMDPSLNSAEIYDPQKGKFTLTKGSMTAHRQAHAASLLQDGTVLLTGGQDDHFLSENTAELYEPKTGLFTALSPSCAGAPPPAGCLSTGRDFHISVTLDDGRVLLAGGINSSFTTISSAELYDPASKTFRSTGSLKIPRSGAAVSLIQNTT